jgi:hypothetical protein
VVGEEEALSEGRFLARCFNVVASAMLPIVVLSSAWAEAMGWSHFEIGKLLLNLDPASTSPAGEGEVCPQCRRHPTDSEGWLFVPDSATATPEQVRGRMVVKCLCGTTYWCTGIYETGDVHQPIGRPAFASPPSQGPSRRRRSRNRYRRVAYSSPLRNGSSSSASRRVGSIHCRH